MTYKEYDNAWLEESGMPCLISCYLRNGFRSDVEMFSPLRTLIPIGGDTNLIFTIDDSSGANITEIISAGNYIYFFYYSADDWMHLVEYDMEANTNIDLEICNGPPYGDEGGGIAYIEGRKIFLISDNNNDYTGVYIIDFATENVDRLFDMEYPITVRSITLSGHVWLYTFGYYSTGWDIWYKDYTANTSWTQIFIDANNDEVINGHYPFFVGEEYLVWFTSRVNSESPYNPVARAWALNLSTLSSQYSAWVGPDEHYNRSGDIISASQGVDGCAYATLYGWYQTSFPPYQYFDYWYKYNPVTNTLTVIHTNNFTDTYSETPIQSRVFSSSNTTYIYDWVNEIFVKQTGIGEAGAAYSRNNLVWGSYPSLLMDDNSESALIPSNNQLHIVNVTTGTSQNVSITNIHYIHHISNMLIAIANSGNYWWIYTVT